MNYELRFRYRLSSSKKALSPGFTGMRLSVCFQMLIHDDLLHRFILRIGEAYCVHAFAEFHHAELF